MFACFSRLKSQHNRVVIGECQCSAVGRDLLAYMVLVANPLSGPSLNRIFNKPPRGIGVTGWQKMQSQLTADPYAPSLPAFLFQGLEGVWVSSEVVQRVRPDFL